MISQKKKQQGFVKLRVKIPPVVQGLIALLLIWVFHKYFPIYRLQFVHQLALSVILWVSGLFVAIISIWAFVKLKTTVNPHTPEKTTELVVIGIYKYSRNPMYLGILLILIGAVVYFGAMSGIIVIAGFIAFINKFQIEPEENALREKFRDSFEKYVQNVGRWL